MPNVNLALYQGGKPYAMRPQALIYGLMKRKMVPQTVRIMAPGAGAWLHISISIGPNTSERIQGHQGTALFRVQLDTFQITDTRSFHQTRTTLHSHCRSTKAAHWEPRSLTKSMGDLNNGTFPVFLQFSNISVNSTDTVSFNYLNVNTGNKNPARLKRLSKLWPRTFLRKL